MRLRYRLDGSTILWKSMVVEASLLLTHDFTESETASRWCFHDFHRLATESNRFTIARVIRFCNSFLFFRRALRSILGKRELQTWTTGYNIQKRLLQKTPFVRLNAPCLILPRAFTFSNGASQKVIIGGEEKCTWHPVKVCYIICNQWNPFHQKSQVRVDRTFYYCRGLQWFPR